MRACHHWAEKSIMRYTLKIATGLLIALSTTACVHKISMQQGNYLEDDQVEKVEEGMTREQVKFLLGTPVADDPFTTDRWNYVYYYRNGRTGESIRKHVTVYFADGKVSRIEKRKG